MVLQTVIGMDSFKDGLQVRQQAVNNATGALEQAKRVAGGVDLPSRERLVDMWPDLRPAERQGLLASAIDVVYVRRRGSGRRNIGERVKIVWHGENTHALLGPGRSAPIRSEDW